MRTLRFVPVLALAFMVFVAIPAAAQEGHPVKGSWLGTWGPSPDHANDVIVILDWDGDKISGIINPGTDNMEIENATLNPDGWMLHFEAMGESASGAALHYVFDGSIENLAFHDRIIRGMWRNENGTGPFEIQRQ